MAIRNKAFLWAAALFAALCFVNTAHAESIEGFQANIQINQDSSINVEEIINYDFGPSSRHGIYRNIPVKYKNSFGNFNLKISGISVKDENGLSQPFTSSVSGDNEQIKIGDPNITLSGKKIYYVDYRIEKAVAFFTDHDELYWNVTGNGWTVPIGQTVATVKLPLDVGISSLQIKCFAGPYGVSRNCDAANLGLKDSKIADEAVFNQTALEPGEGLTIVFGWPKGIVKQASLLSRLLSYLLDNFAYGIPVLVLLVLTYIWWTRGRDPEAKGTIVAQYEPLDNLTPTETGTVVDERADNQDISADVIYLATKGYIKITRITEKVFLFSTTDYQLDLLKNGDDLENDFEKKMLETLFEQGKTVKISELKRKAYKGLADVKKKVYESVVAKGYFSQNPNTVRLAYVGAGVVSVFLGVLVGGKVFHSLPWVVGLVISGFLLFLFSFFMPQKTKKGAEAKEYILGLKLYLSVAEKDRINFHNAPEKSPERFEKLLPYAMVLGVEKEWAKQFEDMYISQPSWYSDPTSSNFNSFLLVSSLHNFGATANNALFTAPHSGGSGFGGGGFSGGGFGGGGGGSW